ncbi:hypothetical protein TrRE_jg8235 [Triparma retinervis]|uniref:RGS domain-containing protein n=1 Tax=Triparma retinervis TaxID=2557542 RepID=A0A9W7DMQ8_9STRA|nr:hypothetical protein TrRE_jg8235 [Triparma retinervis]
MGGFVSRAAEAPVDEKGYPRVHVPTGRRLSGRPRVGSFSAGPKTLTKLRTRSDFCLVKIFEEKIVLKAFQLWCKDEKCAEASTFLSFISSVDSVKGEVAGLGIKAKRAKTMKVFNDFISAESSTRLAVDSATVETITQAFESRASDENVFDLAYEKCYQRLKFEFMPRFLISESFTKLEDRTRERRGSSTKVVDMNAILNEPKALKTFEKFLASKKNANMIEHTNLWIGTKRFTELYEKKKAGHIQTKECLQELQVAIKELQTKAWTLQQDGSVRLPKGLESGVSNQFNAAPDGNTIMLCYKLMNFLADVLHTQVQRAFLKSSLFEDFQRHAPEDFVLDTVVMHLSTFKDDRRLKATKEDYVGEFNKALEFNHIFTESLLSAYYRRYLRLTFCEENYFFVQEVYDLKNNEPLKRRWWIDDARRLDIDPDKHDTSHILKLKCMSIYEHYIIDGRKYEINIPDKAKKEIKELVESGKFEKEMFRKCENEILRLLQQDTFTRFKKHYIFEHFKKAFFIKFSHKNFVVGEKIKVTQ